MPDPRNAAAHPSRRAVLGAAWAVPVVALAVAAPAAAASGTTPVVHLSAFRSAGNNFITVGTYGVGGAGVATPFAIQAQQPNLTWTNIVNSQATDASGVFGSSLPDAFIAGYVAIRILAQFPVYGILFSNEIAVPLP